MAVFPALIIAAITLLYVFFGTALWVIFVQVLLVLKLAWVFSFFRHPLRNIVPDESVLYSPADGKVTDISEIDDPQLGRLVKIGIFLSIFNVHLNRVPCSVIVDRIEYKKGEFLDARDPECSNKNESNTVYLTRLSEPKDKLMVRQLTGALARHIVCKVKSGDELKQGDLYGMIKFGSRTELYFPAARLKANGVVEVQIGDKVKAGITPLVKYS